MSKRLILILALAFVIGAFGAAYAEVQNVKVSGDIIASTVSRQMFGLGGTTSVSGNKKSDTENLMTTQVRVRVDADLTDNVAATVRLLNERAWNHETNSNTEIDLDLAYVSIKEFLYSPLSLTVGRQEIRWGNALVLGNSRTYNSGSSTTVLGGLPSDLSLRKSFDAITATLDYDPLVITGLYAKIDSKGRQIGTNGDTTKDTDLWGVDVAYDFGVKGTKADIYFLSKQGSYTQNASTTDNGVYTRTLGALLSAKPIENMIASVEGAYQFGHSNVSGSAVQKRAFALQAMADYTFAKVKYTPALGASYTYLSGSRNTRGHKDRSWDRMFYDQSLNSITYAILPFSNLRVFNLKGSVKPVEDVTVGLNWGYYTLAQKVDTLIGVNADGGGTLYSGSTGYTMNNESRALGNALDLTATYDYTEDVQFGIVAGWFRPGKAFAPGNRSNATQFIGSMKVTF